MEGVYNYKVYFFIFFCFFFIIKKERIMTSSQVKLFKELNTFLNQENYNKSIEICNKCKNK